MTARSFMDGRELCTVGGRTWFLDKRQLIDLCIANGGWEAYTTAAIRSIVKPGMVALDVGANIGWFTVILSELVGDAGRVVAFEAMAEPAALVRRHIELNRLGNAVLSEIALDDRDWEEESGWFNYSWARDPKDAVDQPRHRMIHRTLDGLQADLGLPRIDFIKIDVDGYEAKMLRGARRILETDHPAMLLEVCDYTLRQAAGKPAIKKPHDDYGKEAQAMLTDLVALGYRFFREETFAEVDIPAILEIVDLSRSSVNVVLRHETGGQ